MSACPVPDNGRDVGAQSFGALAIDDGALARYTALALPHRHLEPADDLHETLDHGERVIV